MPNADFGPMLVETDVDRAVLLTLRRWVPTYLAEAERKRSLPNRTFARPLPESYQNVLEDDEFPSGRLPAVIVTTAQTEDVQANTLRSYGAEWSCNISAVVRGRTAPETREIAAIFGGCIRSILVHQGVRLSGCIRWDSSSVAPVDDITDQGRWLAAAINRFTVVTDHVVGGDGPVFPISDPFPEDSPDAPYDPLVTVRAGGVITTIVPRS